MVEETDGDLAMAGRMRMCFGLINAAQHDLRYLCVGYLLSYFMKVG
jgi:hypothetical protein